MDRVKSLCPLQQRDWVSRIKAILAVLIFLRYGVMSWHKGIRCRSYYYYSVDPMPRIAITGMFPHWPWTLINVIVDMDSRQIVFSGILGPWFPTISPLLMFAMFSCRLWPIKIEILSHTVEWKINIRSELRGFILGKIMYPRKYRNVLFATLCTIFLMSSRLSD